MVLLVFLAKMLLLFLCRRLLDISADYDLRRLDFISYGFRLQGYLLMLIWNRLMKKLLYWVKLDDVLVFLLKKK